MAFITYLLSFIPTIGQIDFPATQVPSSGANVLDDYEEGTWTPALVASDNSQFGQVYAAQTGNYIKIGRQVTLNFIIQFSNMGTFPGATDIQLSGLPFPNQNAGGSYVPCHLTFQGIGINTISITGYMPPSFSKMILTQQFVASTSSLQFNLDASALTNTTQFIGGISYFTDN